MDPNKSQTSLKPKGSNSRAASRKNSRNDQDQQTRMEEITVVNSNGKWKLVKKNLAAVVNYGRKEGLIGQAEEHQNSNDAARNAMVANENDNEKEKKTDEDVIKILTEDVSLAHSAIPFLPVPVAIVCLILNICLPGIGTIFGGLATICMGQPRLTFKEGRVFMSVVINFFVGIAQLVTITFMLVGWFWSIAWGGLILMHSSNSLNVKLDNVFSLLLISLLNDLVEYRTALMKKRQEAVATAAIEALTKDAILRKKDVQNLVQENTNRERRKSSISQAIQNKFKRTRKTTKKNQSKV